MRPDFSARGAAVSLPYLDYAVRWPSGQSLPGRHPSRAAGTGGDFRAFRAFRDVPDSRRIDIRRSMLDPFEELVVRQTEQRSGISVIVAADLSRSMQAANMSAVSLLAQAASRSAHKAGDRFGFIGFDAVPRGDFTLPCRRGRGAAAELLARLQVLRPQGTSAAGIAELAPLLPRQRSLVILVSDFLMPHLLLEQALASLFRHDVAPVVLHEAREHDVPSAGLMRLRDAESGGTRLLLMHPALRRRWHAARTTWRKNLDALFAQYCRPAFHAEGALDLARLSEHLRMI
jgi:uncharacterized protein (DUF58 family)